MENEIEKYRRGEKAAGVLSYLCIALCAVCMLGVIVCAVLIAWKGENLVLFCSLGGGAIVGVALFGVLALLFTRMGARLNERGLDVRERRDGEESFFVGEGTLLTFGEDGFVIHGERGEGRRIRVPYSEARFFSLCARSLPREKGVWSVLIEIPQRYLAKSGAPQSGPPALVETAGKERLYRAIGAHGLTLIGEPPEEKRGEKFVREKKFLLPDKKKRTRAAWLMAAGAVLVAVGGGLAFRYLTIGLLIAVLGVYLAGRALIAFVRAKRQLSVFREGLYMKEQAGADSVFLKWSEIVSLVADKEGLRVECAYGPYRFPLPAGAWDYLCERFPERCRREDD